MLDFELHIDTPCPACSVVTRIERDRQGRVREVIDHVKRCGECRERGAPSTQPYGHGFNIAPKVVRNG